MEHENKKITDPVFLPEDAADRTLRPERLEEFVGQEKITSNLKVFIKAALQGG